MRTLAGSAGGATLSPVLEVSSVAKSYRQGGVVSKILRRPVRPPLHALREVTFDVFPGEMVGLLGPNGAGKTTLLKIISTMVTPTSGKVRVCGRLVDENPPETRRRIGLVASDERSFYWRLTGRQNLEFFAALYDVPRHIAPGRIAELFDRLGLAAAADRPFSDYSSGMKQKMAIARGLMGSPSLVLYDEPTRALDPLSTRSIREWMRENREKSPEIAHVIATNQMDEAEQLCDRLIVLNRGRIVSSGTQKEIRSRFQRHAVHRITCRGLRNGDELRPNQDSGILAVSSSLVESDIWEIRIETVLGGTGLTPALEFLIGQGAGVIACETEEVPLEDVICSILLDDHKTPEAEEVSV